MKTGRPVVGGQKDGPMPGIASGETDPAKLQLSAHPRGGSRDQAGKGPASDWHMHIRPCPRAPRGRSVHLFGIITVIGLADRTGHHFLGDCFLLAANLVFQLRHHLRILEQEAFRILAPLADAD